MNGKIEIDVFDSIEQISPGSWDSVAGESVGINHAVLLCHEKHFTGTVKPRYFHVRTSDKSMAVSVAVIQNEGHEAVLTLRLFGRLAARIGPLFRSLDCALVCRSPGPGAAVLTRRDADEQRWVRIICGAMEKYAASHHLTMAYTGVIPKQSSLLSELRRRKYLDGIEPPIATLDVTWRDTKSYLETLKVRRKKKYANTAKTEMRRFGESGARISRFSGTDYGELYELLRQHSVRKNASDLQFRPGILEDLVRQLGDDCIVYVAQRAAIPIGVIVFVRRNEKAWAWLIGINHEADANSFCYFNLCFYHPCSQFPEMGIRQVFYGNAVQYAKYRRGCDIVETRFFVRSTPGVLALILRPVFAVQRIFFRRKFRAVLPQGSENRK